MLPAVGPFPPFPFGHPDLGDGLTPLPNLVIVQNEGAGPSRVHSAGHVANLVGSALQGQDLAADEGAHHIFVPEASSMRHSTRFRAVLISGFVSLGT